jgi:hypothetical protein
MNLYTDEEMNTLKQFLHEKLLQESFKQFDVVKVKTSVGYKTVTEEVAMIQVLAGSSLMALLKTARSLLQEQDVRFAYTWDTQFNRGMLMVWPARIAHEFMLKAIDTANAFHINQPIAKLYHFTYAQEARIEAGKEPENIRYVAGGLIMLSGVYSGVLFSTLPKSVIEAYFGSPDDSESIGMKMCPHDYPELLTNKEPK